MVYRRNSLTTAKPVTNTSSRFPVSSELFSTCWILVAQTLQSSLGIKLFVMIILWLLRSMHKLQLRDKNNTKLLEMNRLPRSKMSIYIPKQVVGYVPQGMLSSGVISRRGSWSCIGARQHRKDLLLPVNLSAGPTKMDVMDETVAGEKDTNHVCFHLYEYVTYELPLEFKTVKIYLDAAGYFKNVLSGGQQKWYQKVALLVLSLYSWYRDTQNLNVIWNLLVLQIDSTSPISSIQENSFG